MKIPIEALKEFSKKYDLTHTLILAYDVDGVSHIATYGKTIEQCSKVADKGNELKKLLDWPESLHKQPSRVRKLQNEIKELKKVIGEKK